jgi:tetratricopeptide (TPR) repeat protein
MLQSKWVRLILFIVGLALLAVALYQVPAINNRLYWRLDIALTYLRGVIQPAGAVPTPNPQANANLAPDAQSTRLVFPQPSLTASPLSIETQTQTLSSPTPVPFSPTPSPSPTALPERASLPAPAWEKQDWNNCGPAALAMYLRFYGWEGDQFTISDLLKPVREDRNVNVEELAYYARTRAGWLQTQYRVGGDLQLLKAFIAAGIPVMIESSFFFDAPYWPNDDLWAAHYLLVTAYDDAEGTFNVQDTFRHPDRKMDYATLDEYWRTFNRVYMLIYLPEQEATVQSILGPQWDVDANRQGALEAAQAEIETNPKDAFAWFNLGTNLVYFERYNDAAEAYDEARELGLPQRMLRYQFGPFLAYFHAGRTEELLTLTEYALQRTPNSEEALLWRGWGRYRQGDSAGAIADFRAALESNPNSLDAQYALDYVTKNP